MSKDREDTEAVKYAHSINAALLGESERDSYNATLAVGFALIQLARIADALENLASCTSAQSENAAQFFRTMDMKSGR